MALWRGDLLDVRAQGVQAWIERLNQSELPALASVVKDLQRPPSTSMHRSSSLPMLLRDASLTSKVLRVGNSSYYNPPRKPSRPYPEPS